MVPEPLTTPPAVRVEFPLPAMFSVQMLRKRALGAETERSKTSAKITPPSSPGDLQRIEPLQWDQQRRITTAYIKSTPAPRAPSAASAVATLQLVIGREQGAFFTHLKAGIRHKAGKEPRQRRTRNPRQHRFTAFDYHSLFEHLARTQWCPVLWHQG